MATTSAAPPPPSFVAVVTGGTGGIGYHSARLLAALPGQPRVMVTGRDRARGEAARDALVAATGNDRVELVIADVSSRAGVDALADDLRARCGGGGLNVLVNNVGYLGGAPETNVDGFEMHFHMNVVVARRLTQALLPQLKQAAQNKAKAAAGGAGVVGARVVNVTAGDGPAPVDPDNLQAEKGFKGLMTMTHSKSVMEAMSMAMAKELEPDGVSLNVVFPGRASTEMTRSLTKAHLPGCMCIMLPCMRCFFRDDGGKGAAKAARSTVFAATDPGLAGVTGKYFTSASQELPLHSTTYDLAIQTRIIGLIDGDNRAGAHGGSGESKE